MTSGYCPWTRLPTGCYQYFQDSQNWTAAQTLCRRRGGRLAELEGEQRENLEQWPVVYATVATQLYASQLQVQCFE